MVKKSSLSPKKAIHASHWLWVARLYKTPVLAKAAIGNGNVLYNGNKFKSNQIVSIGDKLTIITGTQSREITILSLSKKRCHENDYHLLYSEPGSYSKSGRKILKINKKPATATTAIQPSVRYLRKRAQKLPTY